MAIAPFLYLSIWYHNWIALGIIILWAAVNPIVFPKPKNTNSWVSRVVLGEKLWLENIRKKAKPDLSLILNILTALFFIPSIYFTYVNMFWPALYCATLTFIFKVWFCDRVALHYEKTLLKNSVKEKQST